MKIEIWSDFMCPFCYIGEHRLKAALEQFPHKNKVEFVYRSFELDPNAKRDYDTDIYGLLAAKYGTSVAQAKAMNANLAEQGKQDGLTFNFDNFVPTNSFDAHRLSHYAATQGKMDEFMERGFYAGFTEGKHLGDHETLLSLATEVGLNTEEAAAVLASDAFTKEVRADEQEGAALGITGVPFFVINRKYAISGAQPTELFLQTLQKVWDEEQPLTMINGADSAVCTDEGCEVPKNKES
ncbi:DsbA family oxidoreductase [Ectobacillus antri]|jgi:predicted DsbA family dithiol-disulfide isomerase|uniref:DsbA family oxidoreductase n=1 Tax=Ectobacillus antri TaxID=2486280 RepID=A0ABT6H4X4_9BACI|nr:DsbA family oxidoreductase [Ectobacillus antri]MDG4657237.1 DsbA family oxidoreductase [Ectobacillus antri]MDG5754411.1 DsbA family oxidoreductase [Ectobacillus antri]